ncbi:MAG: hypothetical protein LUC44_01605 [Prevotellaceae bacterium]|nr:hypothetical protein [Prevotellaceae bacterium]
MRHNSIDSCPALIDYINEVGFLPLLPIGIPGWSAEEAVSPECRYSPSPDGGMDWPLWEWKSQILRESGCAYGKFLRRKACFISRGWWPDFCQLRRAVFPRPAESSIEESILFTLRAHGSLITRDLRSACGLTGPKMRGRFDSFIAQLQMATYIVTEDFVHPTDKHGREYGWGLALLTTPESLFGHHACSAPRSPRQSRERILSHLASILPDLPTRVIESLLK